MMNDEDMDDCTPLYHALSGTRGYADARVVHPDGAVLVRIQDHWWFLKDCTLDSYGE